MKELSIAFRPRGLLLSTAVSPSKQIIDKGYDVPTLSEYFDWIAVMTYDFHGQWDKKTGHVAPLFEHPDDDISYFNAVSCQIFFYLTANCMIDLFVFPFPELLFALLDGEGSSTTKAGHGNATLWSSLHIIRCQEYWTQFSCAGTWTGW